jgi:hypothetical protein
VSWAASWPSGDGRSVGGALEGIIGGGGGGGDGVASLLEWPRDRSLKR